MSAATNTSEAVHQTLRLEVRNFLAAERAAHTFTPGCDGWSVGYDRQFSRKLGAQGWLGMTWPRQYGGGEHSSLARFVVVEELLAAGAPVAAHWCAERQTGPLLLRFGTEAQRQAVLPRIASGDLGVAIGMSEPDSGSDLASVRTRATEVADGWRISGSKVWTSHAHEQELILALVRTSPVVEGKKHAGLSQFLIPLDLPGIDVRPIVGLSGDAHFNEVVFDDVPVSVDMLVGEVGNGWAQVTAELAAERSGPERYLSSFPLFTELVRSAASAETDRADEVLGTLAARAWSLHEQSLDINRGLESGFVDPAGPALVKDAGTEFEVDLVEAAHRAFALGVPRDDAVDHLYRQALTVAPTFTIRGGASEILRTIVAKTWRS